MVNYLIALIFGAIQGATEFLPVSSSGHLVILHKLFPAFITNDLAFDIILHLATLVALVWFFRLDIKDLCIALLGSLRGEYTVKSKVAWLVIIGIIPALVAGYFFSDAIEGIFRAPHWVAVMLVLVGMLFIIFEKICQQNFKTIDKLNWQNALIIGLAQVLSFIPGTSRSGITIIAGLANGLKREAAVRFSFLMSIPLIAAAGLNQASALAQTDINQNDMVIYIISFFAAALSGYFAIKYFLRIAEKYSLNIFAYYRFILAAVIIIYFYFL